MRVLNHSLGNFNKQWVHYDNCLESRLNVIGNVLELHEVPTLVNSYGSR
jgi:hypothetical protein